MQKVNCLTCEFVKIRDKENYIVSCSKPNNANVFIDKAGVDMGKVYWPSKYVAHFVWDCDNFENSQ